LNQNHGEKEKNTSVGKVVSEEKQKDSREEGAGGKKEKGAWGLCVSGKREREGGGRGRGGKEGSGFGRREGE